MTPIKIKYFVIEQEFPKCHWTPLHHMVNNEKLAIKTFEEKQNSSLLPLRLVRVTKEYYE